MTTTEQHHLDHEQPTSMTALDHLHSGHRTIDPATAMTPTATDTCHPCGEARGPAASAPC
jgi:hypothetical protein